MNGLEIPDDVREILHTNRFRFYVDDSHENKELSGETRGRESTVASVLFGPSTRPYLRIDLDFTATAEQGDADADEAMRVAFGSLKKLDRASGIATWRSRLSGQLPGGARSRAVRAALRRQ